ncbi:MAG: LuxR family transcriptional regulator [Bacteroidetes bacterium]|nr:LuxR family transcriptional regulator [Bacteroidota bacterium]
MSVLTQFVKKAKPSINLQIIVPEIANQLERILSSEEKVRFLLKYSSEILLNHPRKSKTSAELAESYAKQTGNEFLVADCQLVLEESCRSLGEYSTALQYSYEALKIGEFTKNEILQARAQYSIGVNYSLIAEHTKALDKLNSSLGIHVRYGNFAEVRSIYHALGSVYEMVGNYPKALEFHQMGLEISEHLEDKPSIGAGLNYLGNVYWFLENYDTAEESYFKSLAILRSMNDVVSEGQLLGNIAAIMSKTHRTKEALAFLFEALAIFEKINNLPLIVETYSNIGSTYLENKEYIKALTYLRDALVLAESAGKSNVMQSILLYISTAYFHTEEYHRSLEFAQQALDISQKREDKRTQYQTLQLTSQIWEVLKNIEKAFYYHKEFTRVKEEYHGIEKQKLMAEMQIRFEVDKAEKEREIYRLKAEKLELDIQLKNRELTMLALHVAQKNEFIDKMHQKMNFVGKSTEITDTKKQINQFAEEMRSNIRGESQWPQFQQKFTQLHPEFMRTLSKKYNSLTPTELKICALLKINLSSKEIANILSVSIHNIEMHRYRIRKKFQLPTEANLASFLAPL